MSAYDYSDRYWNRLSLYSEKSWAGYFVLDAQLRFVEWSAGLARLARVQADQLSGTTIQEALSGSNFRPSKNFRTLANTASAMIAVDRSATLSQARIYLHANGSGQESELNLVVGALPGHEDEPAGYLGVLILQKSNGNKGIETEADESFGGSAEVEPRDAFLIAAVPEGSIVSANQEAAGLLGYSHHEFLQLNSRDLVTSAGREQSFASLLEKPDPGDWFSLDTAWRRKDGSELSIIASGVWIDVAGRQFAFMALRELQLELAAWEEEQEQLRLTEALRDVSEALTSTLDMDEVLGRILSNLGKVISYVTANVMFIAEGKTYIASGRGYTSEPLIQWQRNWNAPLDEFPILMRMANTLQPVVYPDTYEERSWIRLPETDWIRSYVGAPIIRDGKIYGFINVNSDHPGEYDEKSARHLMAFADQASIALENARLFQETRIRADRLGLLNGIATSINEPTDLSDVMQRAASGLAAVLDVEQTGIALLSDDGRYLEVVAEHKARGNPDAIGDRIPVQDNPSLAYIFANKKSLAILNAQSDPLLANIHGLMNERNVKSILLVPIIVAGEVYGTVGCDAIREPRTFTNDDINLAETLAGLISMRIEQTRLFESVQQQASELEQIRRILHQVNATSDIAGVLEEIGRLLKFFTGAARISIGLLSDNRDHFILYSPDETVEGLIDRNLYPTSITAAADDLLSGRIHQTADLAEELAFPAEQRLYEAGFRSRMNFPLITADGVIGSINFVWTDLDGFAGKNLEALEQVADAVALAVDRGNMLEQTRKRDAILEILALAAERLLQAATLDSVAPELLKRLGQVMDASRAYIYENTLLADGRLLMSERFGWSAEDAPHASRRAETQELGYEESGLGRWRGMLAEREPVVGVVNEFPSADRAFLQAQAVQAIAILPIFVRGEWWGFFGFDDCRRERLWSKAELEALKSLAETLGGALARIQSETAEREQLRLAEALRDVAMVLTATTKIENVLEHILRNVAKVIEHDTSNIMLLQAGMLNIAAAQGYNRIGWRIPRERFPLPLAEFSNFVKLAQSGEALIISDTQQDPDWIMVSETSEIRSYIGAPIRFNQQTIGFINLDSRQPGFFTENDAAKLMAFANQAAIAIENTRLFEETHDRAMQMSLLNKITQSAISANSAEEVVHTLTEQITDLLSGDKSFLALWDPEKNKPGVVTSTENLFARVTDAKIVAEVHLLTEQAVKRGHVQVIEDLNKSNLLPRSAIQAAGGVTVLTLPLSSNRQIHGSVVVVYNSRQVIDLNVLSLGEQAAGQIALAIAKTRLLETETIKSNTLERINIIFTALSHVSVRLETARDPDEVLETLGQELRELDINCVVWMLDPEKRELNFRYASLTGDELRLVNRVFGQQVSGLVLDQQAFSHFQEVIQQGKPVFLADFRNEMSGAFPDLPARVFDMISKILGLSDAVSGFFLPLVSEDKVMGTIWMLANEFTEHDQAAATIFASQVAMSLENARLYQNVQQLAITDDLTGLYNRRGLMELGQREFDRARRFKRSLFAVMFDLDDFRNVNNTYGHAIGDEVLRELARRCEAVLRSTDVLGRYGGEEFCVLIPETDLPGAIDIAERLRLNVAARPFETRRADLQVTISLGVAALDAECQDLMELIDLADRGLYRAKRGGKNRVSLESRDDPEMPGFESKAYT